MNNDKLLEEIEIRAKARHEYLLQEQRLDALDIKESICIKFEKRIKSLENSRVLFTGLLAGISWLWNKKI